MRRILFEIETGAMGVRRCTEAAVRKPTREKGPDAGSRAGECEGARFVLAREAVEPNHDRAHPMLSCVVGIERAANRATLAYIEDLVALLASIFWAPLSRAKIEEREGDPVISWVHGVFDYAHARTSLATVNTSRVMGDEAIAGWNVDYDRANALRAAHGDAML